ncbi:MAG: metallophosphoesterase [Planctomycetaceae bacterium]|nr:metallophosphoesterase [Planctomycetaceae bacterium]
MKQKLLAVSLAVGLIVLIAAPAAAEGWKFVVMSDSQGSSGDSTEGVATRTLKIVVDDVVKNVKPDLIMFTGDLVQGAATAEELEKQLMTFRSTMAPVYEAKIPLYAMRGSHDTGPNVTRPWAAGVWNKVFAGPYAMPANGPADEKGLTYSFTHKNATFIAIDGYKTPDTMKLTIDQKWVDAQLAANTAPHVFAFQHTQIKKVEHSESLDNTGPMRDAFVKSLVAAGGRAFFCGHMHVSNCTRLNNDAVDPAAKSEADDFYQIIVPPSCTKSYSWKNRKYDGKKIPGMTPSTVHHSQTREPGYVIVEVDGLKVTLTAKLIDKQGKTRTDYTLSFTAAGKGAAKAAARKAPTPLPPPLVRRPCTCRGVRPAASM